MFTTFCESHTSQVPFHAVARLLRAATGVDGLEGQEARDRVRDRVPDADPEDLALFDDLLGIADPNTLYRPIDPDARRRRLTALVNAASLARESPAVYVVEDAHWIDEVSESLIADFMTVIPQTPSLVLVTYRPEYEGALARVHGAQTIALAPLSDSETAVLVADLLGPNPSVGGLTGTIADRATGNPFFAEEIVRELAECGVLKGKSGTYTSTAELSEVSVPATLQATIAARIDRLDPNAKRTLSAAAVVGSRFGVDLLTVLGIEPTLDELVKAELIDQVRFTRQPEYVFRHPMIRAVAYESQLKSDRAQLHRRLAAAIESHEPESGDENAALVAEHLQAADDLHAAFGWHMRAGSWSTNRDIAAAQMSWERARQVADEVPSNDPEYTAMRIAPRTLLCGLAWRRFHPDISARFEELQQLCIEADDKASLAIGMAGLVMEQLLHAHIPEASRLASEYMAVIESIGDPDLTIGLSLFAIVVKIEAGELTDALRWSQAVIDVAGGDSALGTFVFGSPLAGAHMLRGVARWTTGSSRWREDLDWAVELAHEADPLSHAAILRFKYAPAIPRGVLLADDAALRDIETAFKFAERSSDDVALVQLRMTLGITLVHHASADLQRGFDMLAQVRATCIEKHFGLNVVPILDLYLARQRVAIGDLDGAVTQLRALTENLFKTRHIGICDLATATLVEALLARGSQPDMGEAQAAIERLEGLPVNFPWAVRDITVLRLRTFLAEMRGDEATYRQLRERYRAMATSLGFEGHMKWAEAMP